MKLERNFEVNEYMTQPECDCYGWHYDIEGVGRLTVLDRMTGFGHRDVETGFRDNENNSWLASGQVDARWFDSMTDAELVDYIKKEANTCIPETQGTKGKDQESSDDK